MKKYTLEHLINFINWLQVTNFMLQIVRKPHRCFGIAYVFYLIQHGICSLSLNHKNYNILLLFFVFLVCHSCKEKATTKVIDKPEIVQEADIGGLYQYYHSNPKTLEQKEENRIIEYAADNNMEAVRTRSGVYVANHMVGKGDSVKWGDPISAHYKGYFMDGQEFDSSIKSGKPIKFRVGSMVAGWNEALPFLNIGSKATFLIPSHMGYGKRGFFWLRWP